MWSIVTAAREECAQTGAYALACGITGSFYAVPGGELHIRRSMWFEEAELTLGGERIALVRWE